MNSSLALELFVPIIMANILHMIVVKANLFTFLRVPISVKYFGQNKTYRGLIFLTSVTGILQYIFNAYLYGSFLVSSALLGALLGFVYIICELPNSFVKRRRGIQPGSRSGSYPWLTTIIDKADSTFGVCLFFCIIKNLSLFEFFILFLSAFVIHLIVSKLLHSVKLKESL